MSNASLPKHICVIDADADFAGLLTRYLKTRSLRTSRHCSAEEFFQNGEIGEFDFFIIDLALPGIDGVDQISMIRSRTQAGVLVISGRFGPDAFISALTAGADMVLHKPVRFDQVFHALQAIMRRLHGHTVSPSYGREWRIIAEGRTLISPHDEQITLTPVEAQLIACLRSAGLQPVSRMDLTDAAGISGKTAWRNLDAAIFRLRRKIELKAKAPAPLRTSHGYGYQLSETIVEIP